MKDILKNTKANFGNILFFYIRPTTGSYRNQLKQFTNERQSSEINKLRRRFVSTRRKPIFLLID